MKKNNLYILIGLAAVGGFYFYMKKKKKDIVTTTMQEKITEPVVIQKQEPNPLKSLVKAVKKISKPVVKKAPATTTDNVNTFQSNFFAEAQKSLLTRPVKKEKYNFPFLKPRTIKGLPDFY